MPSASVDAGSRPVVAGVGISHPDRVLFPDPKTTKLDLAHYYESVADWILPHVIDLDPGEDVEWPSVVAAARLVLQLLSVVDLESFVKTTGGRGLHVVVPLTPPADWSQCLDFARAFAQWLVRRQPEMFTERFGKAGRQDKIP